MDARRSVVCAVVLPLLVMSGGAAGARSGSASGTGAPSHDRAQTTTVRYGPFTVPGAVGDEPGMLENAIVRTGGCRGLGFCLDMPVEKPCEDCFITKIVPKLVDPATGETINFTDGGMLHHVVNVNWSRPDVTCPLGRDGGIINLLGALEGGNDQFFATGNERTLFEMPRATGYRCRPMTTGG